MQKNKYILVDAMNMFHRAKHVVHNGPIDMRIGMSLHITFNALRKAWRDLGGNHVVFCLEGRSWRKTACETYKANRLAAQLKRTKREAEDDDLFFEAFNDFSDFFSNQTNCTVLQCPIGEADDLIATWIDLHPDEDHVIVSSDTDFYQLLAKNVEIYNGITNNLITLEGFFDDKGKPVKDKKTGLPKKLEDPEWLLFEKCIRGDKSDNVFPAYPGARKKGSKNKTGMMEAFADRNSGSFDWNNFMLQTWEDHEGNVHRVLDRYMENVSLIDLHAQPDEVKVELIECILREVDRPVVQGVGVHFLRFCGKWDLGNISKYPDEFARMLNTRYKGHLIEQTEEVS